MKHEAALIFVHLNIQEREAVVEELFCWFLLIHGNFNCRKLQKQLEHGPPILLALPPLITILPTSIVIRGAHLRCLGVLHIRRRPLLTLLFGALSRHRRLQVDVQVLPLVREQNDRNQFGPLHRDAV